MLIKPFFLVMLLITIGCTSFKEGYATHFGLTNPENPPIHPNPVDETYSGGTVGQKRIEEYDRKYHDRTIFKGEGMEKIEEEEVLEEQ